MNETAQMNEAARAARADGKLDDALGKYRDLAAYCEEKNDPLGRAHALRHAADILSEQKLFGEAASTYVKVLGTYRQGRDTSSLNYANAIRGYALLLASLGKNQDSSMLWREARDLYDKAGIRDGVRESDHWLNKLESP